MNEIWKKVKDWEDLYEVSNFGNVRSLHYKFPYLMHPAVDAKGYMRVSFVRPNSKKYKRCAVHRLVAEAFIPNPNNLPQINHKDENKSNNRADNLEWCTCKYNCNYGNHCDNVRKSRLNMKFSDLHIYNLRVSHIKSQGKKVKQYDKYNNFIAQFDSISDASRSTNIPITSISQCCRNKVKSAGGFVWKFV